MSAVLRALALAALLLFMFPVPAGAQGEESGRDRVVFGDDATISAGETVRDAFVFGGNLTLDGSASRDVIVFGGNADINGPVGRDLVVFGGNAKLGSSASVGRDIVTWGGNVDRAPGVHVGRNSFEGGAGYFFSPAGAFGLFLISRIIGSLLVLLVAFLCLLFFPRQVEGSVALLQARPGTAFGIGCLALPAGIAAAIVCAITVVLLPVTFAIAVVMLGAWLFGYAAVFLLIGRYLLNALNRRADPIPALLLGGLLLTAISIVPVADFLVGFIVGVLALGAALGSRFGTRGPDQPLFGRRQPAYTPAYPYPYPYPYPYGYPPPAPYAPSAPAPDPASGLAPEPPAAPTPELESGPAPKPRRARKPRAPKPPDPEPPASA